MTVSNNHSLGHFEAEVSRTFLPGCRACHAPHPLARKGYAGDPRFCPECRMPVDPAGATRTQRSVIVGRRGWVLIAELFMNIGIWLRNLAGRI